MQPAKMSVAEIRARFDAEVERFSNLQTGQTATVDAPLCLELITQAAARTNPTARQLLDVGCGAGNYTLKLLSLLPELEVTLLDLSRPMLDRARERLQALRTEVPTLIQGDVREVEFAPEQFDIVLASAVLHHLRTDAEWEAVFAKLYRTLKPGGSLWIFDLVESSLPSVEPLMQERYRRYLEDLNGPEYRADVLAYIEREDTPRPLPYQLDLLRRVGFSAVEVLHKNSCFTAFGAVKAASVS